MGVSKRVFAVFGNTFVEIEVLFFSDFVLASEPDSFFVIDKFPLPNGFGDGFLVVSIFVIFIIVFFFGDFDVI